MLVIKFERWRSMRSDETFLIVGASIWYWLQRPETIFKAGTIHLPISIQYHPTPTPPIQPIYPQRKVLNVEFGFCMQPL